MEGDGEPIRINGNAADESADARHALLDQLRIKREQSRPRTPVRRRVATFVLAGAFIFIALSAGGGWMLLRPATAVPVETTLARSTGEAADSSRSLLDATGYVVARRQATVSSRITGRVREILIEEGQPVAAGQILALLEDEEIQAELREAQSLVETGRARLDTARALAAQEDTRNLRRQDLFTRGFLSAQAADDARAAADTAHANVRTARAELALTQASLVSARRALDDTVVRAPFGGVVTVKAAQPGEIVSPISAGGGFTRTGIGTIVDMNSLEVEVDVAENSINRVQQGMPAAVVLNSYPGVTFAAEVIAVIPKADRSKATVAVRIGLLTPDGRVVPEMGARVSFLESREIPQLATSVRQVFVPAKAVTQTGEGAGFVYVVRAGTVDRRQVRLGQSRGSDIVITEGVASGEQVVVRPPADLPDGAKVKVIADQSRAQRSS